MVELSGDLAGRGGLRDDSHPGELALQGEADRLRARNQPIQSGDEQPKEAGKERKEPLVIDLQENPFSRPERLSKAELENLQYLQEELLALRKCQLNQEAAKNKANGKPADSPEMIERQLKKLEVSLKQEYAHEQFGFNTRHLYARIVAWMENEAIPDSITKAAQFDVATKLRLPPCALRCGGERDGSWDLGLNTSIDKVHPPSEAELDKLQAVTNWLHQSADLINKASLERMVGQEISNRGLPVGWLDRTGENPDRKLQICAERIGLATTVQYCMQAMDLLNRLGGKFPMDPPPGCDPQSLERDRDGNVIACKVKLDLPDTLDPESQSDREKIERLSAWIEKYFTPIVQAQHELGAAYTGIAPVLSIREHQPEEGYGRVVVKEDASGNLSARTLPPAKDGEPASEGSRYNLTTDDYRVEKDEKGNITVTPTVQYWDVPFFSPHNISKTPVTLPIDQTSRTYAPDAFVPVMRDGMLELVQAKDLFKAHEEEQNSQVNGKRLRLGVDAVIGTIMVGSGLAEVYGAAELLSARFGWGALRTVAGLMGTIEGSAGANESNLVRDAMFARGVYFVGDSVLHLRNLWQIWRGTSGIVAGASKTAGAATEMLSSGQKAINLIKAAGGLAIDLPMSYLVFTDAYRKRVRRALEQHDPALGAIRSGDEMSRDNAVKLRTKQ